MTFEKKRLLRILLIFTILFIIISIVYVIFFQKPNQVKNQAVSDKVVEKQIIKDVGIIYYGIDKLRDIGISSKQMKSFKRDFNMYSKIKNNNIKIIEIDKSTINHIDMNKNTHENTINFKLSINKTEHLNATIKYNNLDKLTLFLYDSNNKKLFETIPYAG